MAGGKETPRQKMIGMMYLVLLALLAMNVSKQIVMAFVTLTNKMESQNSTFQDTNGVILNSFEQSLATLASTGGSEEDKALIKMWQGRAGDVHKKALSTANYVIDLAQEMLEQGSAGTWIDESNPMGYKSILDLGSEESDYGKKDDYDTPTRIFVSDGKGDEMLERITQFRDSLCIMIGDIQEDDKQYSFDPTSFDIVKETNDDTTYLLTLAEEMEKQDVYAEARGVITEIYRILTFPETVENHGEPVPWVQGQFDHAPMVAAAAMLTSIKGQILQAEGVALDYFASRNSVPPFKFDTIEPKAFARTAYINSGDSLALQVMIAAYDSKAETELKVWVDDTLKSADNMQSFGNNTVQLGRELGGGIGDHIVKGEIAVEEKGVKKWKEWEFKYKIGAPASAIGNAEMNVMYVGYTNKIAATASGYPKIDVSCSGCSSFGKADGDLYNATVSRPGQKVTINITGTTDDGKKESVAQQDFRVLPMPKPRVYVIGVDPFASSIARSVLASGYLRAQLIGSPLTITSSVTGGQVTVTVQGVSQTYPMSGNAIPAAAANIIRQLRPGATVMIETRALLGGKTITPAPIAYKVL